MPLVDVALDRLAHRLLDQLAEAVDPVVVLVARAVASRDYFWS
jgi:hypothetical protein